MAKKRTSQAGRAVLVTPKPRTDIQVQLDKNDVIAIVISKWEKHHKQLLKNLTDSIAEMQKDINKLEAKLVELMSESSSRIKPHVDALVQAMNNLYSLNAGEVPLSRFAATTRCVSLGATGEDREPMIEYTVSVQVGRDDRRSNHSNFRIVLPYTRECTLVYERIMQLHDQREALEQQALDCKRELSEINTKEREARAALAEEQLSRTTEGAELLESLSKRVGLNYLTVLAETTS